MVATDKIHRKEIASWRPAGAYIYQGIENNRRIEIKYVFRKEIL